MPMLTREQTIASIRGGDIMQFENCINDPNRTQEEINLLAEWYEEAKGNILEIIGEKLPPEEIERLTNTIQARPVTFEEQQAAKNRARAKRGNMLRKLKKTYSSYEIFTPKEASDRTGISLEVMAAYLANEARLPGTDIHFDEQERKYYLMIVF
jgi:hypothetical protein